jgi:polyisoprenoid-binding protein YceI
MTMATTDVTGTPTTTLPAGVWRVDPSSSELGFRSRGMFGLVPVKGTFAQYEGELTVDDAGTRGELRIKAATLDTGNGKRDTHLRSSDFFDVDNHETVTFSLTGVEPTTQGGLTLTGVLQIRENSHEFDAPMEVLSTTADRLTLHTDVSVERAAAGVGWSKAGMIKGPAHLNATLTLVRDDS